MIKTGGAQQHYWKEVKRRVLGFEGLSTRDKTLIHTNNTTEKGPSVTNKRKFMSEVSPLYPWALSASSDSTTHELKILKEIYLVA